MWKKMMPKSAVLQSQKKLQVLEIIFEKKFLPPYLYRYNLQNGMRNIFLNKWVSRYLSLGDIKEKLLFTIKLLIKHDRQKTKKIPHTVLETIISKIMS